MEGAANGRHYSGTAMGWFTNDQYGVKIITHSGGMPGFILNHAVVPEKDLAVIALGNGETSSVFAATGKVLNMFLGDGKADPTARMILTGHALRERFQDLDDFLVSHLAQTAPMPSALSTAAPWRRLSRQLLADSSDALGR